LQPLANTAPRSAQLVSTHFWIGIY
jgi:hypothetical protein